MMLQMMHSTITTIIGMQSSPTTVHSMGSTITSSKPLRDYMNVKTFLNNYVETVNRIRPKYMDSDCCIAIARINQIILEDYHFKVQPVTVQLEIFNEAFVKKGRPPKDEHETRAWADEGVWKIVL